MNVVDVYRYCAVFMWIRELNSCMSSISGDPKYFHLILLYTLFQYLYNHKYNKIRIKQMSSYTLYINPSFRCWDWVIQFLMLLIFEIGGSYVWIKMITMMSKRLSMIKNYVWQIVGHDFGLDQSEVKSETNL